MEPQITKHWFYSRAAKYAGCADKDLELCVRRYGDDVVRLELRNCQHAAQCQKQLQRFLLLSALTAVYFASVWWLLWEDSSGIWQARLIFPFLVVIFLAISILRSTLDLVRTEKLFYSWDMALQTETVRTFGRESVFCVQRGHLHDLVLNEVIENLDVKYMLLLRTKGSLFKQRPLIPLFNSQSPSFECLQHIYRILHGYWLHNSKDRSEQAYSMAKPSTVAS